jgi:hypothetical protein
MKLMTKKWVLLFLFFLLVMLVFILYRYRVKTQTEGLENKPKIAVITAIYGNYDIIKEPNIKNKTAFDWFCFTDNSNMTSSSWKIVNTPYHTIHEPEYYNSIQDTRTKNMMSAKFFKMKEHTIDILKNYDYYIWIDGSISLRDNFVNNINEIIDKNVNLVNFKHSERNNVKDETAFSIPMKKYKSQNLQQQYDSYVSAGFPDTQGLFENTVIVRRNNSVINTLFDDWWEQNKQYSYQDQISYPFVLWKHHITPDYIIPDNVFNNQKYTYVSADSMKEH